MSSKKHAKKSFDKVRLLTLATPSARKQIIQKADREFVDCLSACCNNILKGNVPLTQKEKKKLSTHKQKLRKVAQKTVSLKDKKKIIQTGGFLGAILGPIASVLGGLFAR